MALFNGPDVERALLKMLLGRVAGECAPSQDGVLSFDRLERWVSLLFSRDSPGHRLGFHVAHALGPTAGGPIGIQCLALAAHGGLWGDVFECHGLRFAYLIESPLPIAIEQWLGPVHRRPQLVSLERKANPRLLTFSWPRQPPPIRLAEPTERGARMAG